LHARNILVVREVIGGKKILFAAPGHQSNEEKTVLGNQVCTILQINVKNDV
jgi:hypothetical protein